MKFAILSTLILSLSTSAVASVRIVKEVSSEKLVLMGRPIENRATKEKIALVCTEFSADASSCKKIQFVIFKGTSAFLFGAEMIIQDPSQLQGELKKTYQKLKKTVKYDMGTYWGATAGVLLMFLGSTVGIGVLILANAPGLVIEIAAVGEVIGLGYADIFRGLFDIHAGMRGLMTGQQLAATHTKEGWNWSLEPKNVSPMKFYHYKRSIDLMADELVGREETVFQFTPATPGQCRVNYESNNSELYPDERMTAMSQVLIAKELADKYGCALTSSDRSAEYQLQIDESGHHRSLTLKKNSTGEILEREFTRIKNNDVKNDRNIIKMLN